jgi:hypothetical protein
MQTNNCIVHLLVWIINRTRCTVRTSRHKIIFVSVSVFYVGVIIKDHILIHSPRTHDLKVTTILSSETQCRELCFYLLYTYTQSSCLMASKYFTDMNISGMDSDLTTLINVNKVSTGHVPAGQEFQ